MNSKDLANIMQDKIEQMTGVRWNKQICNAAIVAFTEAVIETLSSNEKIKIFGFGVFENKKFKGRKMTSFGNEITIKDRLVPSFTFSKSIKDNIKKDIK